jgi:RNA polymerase sigma-70 factor (ECF subfamily)
MDGVTVNALPAGEAELLQHLRAGDSAAFTRLMRSNNQRLYRLARGILRDDAEAEEAVQEGYVRAFTHLEGFKGEASLATWLARIVMNEALARLRRRKPTVALDEMADTLAADENAASPVSAPSPEQALARQEIRRTLERAVDALPAGFRSVFILRTIEQMSVSETAAALGIPPETVKTRLHRANKLLRQALSEHFGALFDSAFPFLGPRCDRLVASVLQRLGHGAAAQPAAPERDRTAPSRSPP